MHLVNTMTKRCSQSGILEAPCPQHAPCRSSNAPTGSNLVAPYRAILRYYRCDTPSRAILLREVSTPPKWCDTPHWYLILHRHISAIPHFATYRTIIVRYLIKKKTSTKSFCDTIATSIVRYEKYRCWASKYSETPLGSHPTSRVSQVSQSNAFRVALSVPPRCGVPASKSIGFHYFA